MSITPEQIDEAIKYCFNEVEDTGLRRIDVHDGSYDCFKYHGNTILTALEMVRELTQDDESSLMAKANVWQPIETAPKDGTRFLAYRKSIYPVVCFWNEKHLGTREWGFHPLENPTHWMPLPTLPECSVKNMDERSELQKESE